MLPLEVAVAKPLLHSVSLVITIVLPLAFTLSQLEESCRVQDGKWNV